MVALNQPVPLQHLVVRARHLLTSGQRRILGITGKPGGSKSTISARLATALDSEGLQVHVVPMDGFHLADEALDRLGLRNRKGAPETFDAHGYAALLARLAGRPDHIIYAPSFHRDIEQPLAGAIAIDPAVDLVITEGNYLLLDAEPWPAVRQRLDEVWYCEVDDDLRRQRLVARHIAFGKSPAEAEAWVDTVDEPNARLVGECRGRADMVVSVG